MCDEDKPKVFEFHLTNLKSGVVNGREWMPWAKAIERNEWLKKFGSKNIEWLFDHELFNLYVKLKMVPDPADIVVEKSWA